MLHRLDCIVLNCIVLVASSLLTLRTSHTDMSSHRMVTVTGEAHVLALKVEPTVIEHSLLHGTNYITLENTGGVPLKLRIGQGIGQQAGNDNLSR